MDIIISEQQELINLLDSLDSDMDIEQRETINLFDSLDSDDGYFSLLQEQNNFGEGFLQQRKTREVKIQFNSIQFNSIHDLLITLNSLS